MECPFVPHQRVRCIKTDRWACMTANIPAPSFAPKIGEEFTVGEVMVEPCGTITLRFREIPHRWHHKSFEPVDDLLAKFLAGTSRKKPRQKTRENV